MEKTIIQNCTLYLGDSRKILPTLAKADACVTDPPYGIGVDKEMHNRGGKKQGNHKAANREYKLTDWDNEPLNGELLNLTLQSAKHIILWGGNYFDLPPSRCWLVWDKQNGANCFADCELAWTNLDKPVRLKSHLWDGFRRKNAETRYCHPTQKPLDLMKWCIQQLPPECTTIIDPFMGSGTTGVACAQMGKQFIGIEQDPEYFWLSCKRIRQAYQQPDMFIESAPPEPYIHGDAL